MKATVAASTNVLKRIYPDGVEKVTYQASRLFENCKKDQKFTNEDKAVVVRISGTSGGGARFGAALASQGQSQKARFLVGRKKEYQIYSVDGEAIAATNGEPKAIVNILKDEMDEAMYKFSRIMARRVTGSGGGAYGQISTTTTLSGNTLIFANPSDIQWLEKGDWLQFSEFDGTSSSADEATDLRGSGLALQVTSVNRQAGSCDLSANLNTVSGIAVGDSVFRSGDYAAAMTGIEGWLPIADPSSALFFNLNRTNYDLVRVAGFRYLAGAGQSYQETLISAGAAAQTHGVNDLTSLYMSSYDWGEFINEIGEQRLRDAKDSAVGYKYVDVHMACAAGGTLRVINEPGLRQGYAWGIRDELLELSTAGPCPNFLDHGLGGKGLQIPQNDDAVQGRLGCYGNFIYRNPGKALIVQLAA